MSDGHDRLRAAYLSALERPPEEREAYLGRIEEDPAVVAEVRSLLAHAPASSSGEVRPFESAAVPERIGAFRVTGVLGRGGMGVVYEAQQEHPRRRVALKVMAGAGVFSTRARERFEHEIASLARIRHPNVVKVFEAGEVAGTPYVAMELVDGAPWSSWLGDTPPTGDRLRSILRVGVAVARALEHVHEHGVVHRDVKPANVVVDARGEPVLVDFGLARELDRATMTTGPVGTLATMAPEQLSSDRIDPRVDVFGLGCSLYLLITGRPPYPARSLGELAARFRGGPPAPARRLNSAVSRDLDTVLAQSTALDPRERYATCRDLADDLQCALDRRPTRARSPGPVARCARAAARHRALTAALLVATLASVGAAVQAWRAGVRSRDARLLRDFAAAEAVLVNDERGDTPPLRARRERALGAFLALAEAGEPSGAAWLRVAEVERRLGRTERALVALRRAQDLGQAGYAAQYLRKSLSKQPYSEDVQAGFSDPLARARWSSVDLHLYAEGRLAAGDLPSAHAALASIEMRRDPLLAPEVLHGVVLMSAATREPRAAVLDSRGAELLGAWQAFDSFLEAHPCELTALQNLIGCLESFLTDERFASVARPAALLERAWERLEGRAACSAPDEPPDDRTLPVRAHRANYLRHVLAGDAVGARASMVLARAELEVMSDDEVLASDEYTKLVEMLAFGGELDRARRLLSRRHVVDGAAGPVAQIAALLADVAGLPAAEADLHGFLAWLDHVDAAEPDVHAAIATLEAAETR